MRITHSLLVFLCCLGVTVGLYYSIVNKPFVSDDYTVLYRLILFKDFTPLGFFRPGSDISLYTSYLVGGMNPLVFNITGLVVHAFNAWLLFKVCAEIFKKESLKYLPAFSCVIFLFYPFHQEAVVWILGRGILLAVTFALCSIWVLCFRSHYNVRLLVSALFYLAGTYCYESILLLPVLNLGIIFYLNQRNKLKPAVLIFSIALAVHLITRIVFSGSLVGVYGKNYSDLNFVSLLFEGFKSLCRMVMFPMHEKSLFIILSVIVLFAGFYVFIRLKQSNHEIKNVFLYITFFMLISLCIPSVFGMPVTTSESDRFLYFPSILLSVLIGMLLISFARYRLIILSLMVIIGGLYIVDSNIQWKKAADRADGILEVVSNNQDKQIRIIRLPGSCNGKYIFRNGFQEALKLRNLQNVDIKVRDTVFDMCVDLISIEDEKDIARPGNPTLLLDGSAAELKPIIIP